ncbi:hypothetical protein BGZ98_009701 [Dissophora globulifera]|nr:hypothetical protein BGZ98_009701 [Dissophora globulifera]
MQASHQQSSPLQQQQSQVTRGMTEEELEEIEDRRRMQQRILRDKLAQAESNRQPDPSMTVKMTTNAGFALGAFDMSESLAIVEDLLDYFGEDDLINEFESAECFNESHFIEAERSHLQRESLVRHMYDSEEDYLRSLQDILSCYRQPLLLNLQNAEAPGASKKMALLSSSSKAVATKQEIDTLFGNLEQLIEFHVSIRALLEERSKIWGPTQIMSDLLIAVIPKFKIYREYFSNFHAALTVLDRISRTPQYKKFMEQCAVDNAPGTASLHLMLAFPLRRLPVYRDMVRGICEATQPGHPDYFNLMRAQEMVNVVAMELREERQIAQEQLTLWDIQSNMVGAPEPILIPGRRLILRADLHRVDSSLVLEPRTYYLMNDVLLYARFDPKKNIYTFKGMFDMTRTQINNPEDNVTLPQLPNCIQIANAGRKQMMRCRSREERDYWMDTMRKVAQSLSPDDGTGVSSREALPGMYSHLALSDTSSVSGYPLHPTLTAGSSRSATNSNTTRLDSRSIHSKSSNDSGSTSATAATRPRKPNPQADFYGCSFGMDIKPHNNEDNYRANNSLALRPVHSNSSSSSAASTGNGTVTTNGSGTSHTTNNQSLGAMLAAIPVEQLTPKQAKAKAALAAAVEARRQERLKREMKNGGAGGGTVSAAKADADRNANVNMEFAGSFIPGKERIARSMT